jgi:tetratricopeptide (TPR) repeat protein
VIASTAARALVAGLALVACAEPTPRPAVADAPAAASEAPEPTPAAALRRAPEIVSDDDPRVTAAMARGRAAFDAKDFGGALLAFDEAHAVAPDSAKVLSELGWAAFHAGDLPRAQSELARAVELATDAKIAGAAWYNLGRVREAQGRLPSSGRPGCLREGGRGRRRCPPG